MSNKFGEWSSRVAVGAFSLSLIFSQHAHIHPNGPTWPGNPYGEQATDTSTTGSTAVFVVRTGTL